MGAVDYWCNLFTPEGIKHTFQDPPEVADVVKWWGLEFTGMSAPEFEKYLDHALSLIHI